MMFTEQEYNYLSDQVYEVDKKKNSTPWGEGDELTKFGKFYKVFKAEDTPDSGMQVRTVGAIKGGEVGKSHIMIVYVKSNYLLASW
ncbi:TPA: hypothetical protein TVE87_001481 [Streptococcus equi subsp. zooepidemicus]|nr:hypothetical protein [Streptococcus equi subsp. zooepidemicus]